MSAPTSAFTFIDLFAGIGGFHAVLSAMGGTCVYASEIDPHAAATYARNWNMKPHGDIVPQTDPEVLVPDHDVLAAGFPCQPFSKSGFQRGMDEARGTLFWNICRIIEAKKPKLVILENVRNLAGPRHRSTWAVIIKTLRELGYAVSDTPTVLSPHRLHPDLGGRPQTRDRVFIMAYRADGGQLVLGDAWAQRVYAKPWLPSSWRISAVLQQDTPDIIAAYGLKATERRWIAVWDDLVTRFHAANPHDKLPGFPLWADVFTKPRAARQLLQRVGIPAWKRDFITKNIMFGVAHRKVITGWMAANPDWSSFPESRRKMEWQAGHASSLMSTLIHFRPSGIRAKAATYAPALVAINQTSIVASRNRVITPREAARLQGLPDWFDLSHQRDALSYKQMGNGINVGIAYQAVRAFVAQHLQAMTAAHPTVTAAIMSSDASSDTALASMSDHIRHAL